MFYLHISNRTEQLLDQLAAVIDAGGRPNLFEKEVFLVQSQGMERIISQHLASVFKVWCNFSYFLPLGFLQNVAEKLGVSVDTTAFDRKHSLWNIEGLLRDIEGEECQTLQGYLGDDLVELKRFGLARQIAHVFDQYQLMRPDMLAAWARGERVTEEDSELWQMYLWRRLQGLLEGEKHRGEVFADLIQRLPGGENFSLPARVSVFGLHIMPPVFLEFLKALAQHIDVHLYVLSPCQEYWGDVEGEKSRLLRMLCCKEAGGSVIDYREEEPQQLLASLGKQGRDFQRMLVENVDFHMEFASYHEPFDAESPRLLHGIQQDLLLREGHTVGVEKDDSLKIISCHSRLRELAVLKDYLLDRLYKDPELQLRDIVVMAPDIQDYAALIPALFSDIQHSIADRAVRRRNTIMADFEAYLALFSGRFGWTEILDLMRSPHICPQFELEESDFEAIERWLLDTGVRWGLSGASRARAGFIESDTNTWVAGLERLLLGVCMGEGEFDGIAAYPDIEGNMVVSLGGLCEFIAFLREREERYGTSHSLEAWASFLQRDAERLFGEDEDDSLGELQNVLFELAGHKHDYPVSFQVIRQWLQQAASESRSSTGFLRGQLTFCSMLPMRSIPFKVVCLLGMGEENFPKRDSFATFDLLGKAPRLGDRSPRVDDRYQFLEALISARDYLYISYIGRSIKNNEDIAPSVVVSELLDILSNHYGIDPKKMVEEQPLHPFSHRYFSGEGGLFSYDKRYLAIAEKLYEVQAKEDRPWWTGDAGHGADVILLQQLVNYYKNPQSYFVKNVLGIKLRIDDSLPEESESFEVGGLDAYLLQQDIVKARLKGGKGHLSPEGLARDGRWPLAAPGKLAFDKQEEELESFVERIQGLDLGEKRSLPIDMRIGEYRLVGTIELDGNILLKQRFAKEKGKDVIETAILHLVAQTIDPNIKSYLVTEECTRIFEGVDKSLLTRLVHGFALGHLLTVLHIEAAYAYTAQDAKARSKTPPLVKAQASLDRILENDYEPETTLLLGEAPVLDEAFEGAVQDLFAPLLALSKVKECKEEA